jgi:hypothetical protein
MEQLEFDLVLFISFGNSKPMSLPQIISVSFSPNLKVDLPFELTLPISITDIVEAKPPINGSLWTMLIAITQEPY